MRIRILMLFMSLFILSNGVSAQSFGKKLKDKVLNKLENKSDEKIDQALDSAVDKPVDKTEEKVKESAKGDGANASGSENQPPADQSAQMEQILQSMGAGAVKLEDYPESDAIEPSDFSGSFDMDFETYKNDKLKESGKVSWHIREYDLAILPESGNNGKQQSGRIVIDRRKGLMIILPDESTGSKNGMVMKLNSMSVDISETEAGKDLEDLTVNVFKNDRRTINGYNCYRVEAESSEFRSESWVTEDLSLDMQQLFGFLSVNSKGKNTYEEKFGHIKGMVIESTSIDNSSGEKNILRINDIRTGKPDAAMFSTDGYSLMELPDFGNFGQ